MTKKHRRLIYWIFVAIFIVVSVVIIYFAQGWRLDFKNFKIVKTGGIFIKTSVSDAKIYVSDKYFGSTAGILNYTKLVSSLTPKNYNIFIYKEGYYPWNKIINVKSGLVTELFNITLFPIDLKKIKIAELPLQTVYRFTVKDKTINVVDAKKSKIIKIYDINGKFISIKNFKIATSTDTELISPDGNKRLYIENNKIFIDYLSDTEKEPYKKMGEKELVTMIESPILLLNWLSDSEHIIWFSNEELTIAEIDNRGGKRNSVKIYINIKPPFFWDSENSNLYFFENNKEKLILYKINIE